VAREFGHEAVLRLLLERTPDKLKASIAAQLGDEGLLRGLLAADPRLVQRLSAAERRKLPDAARDSNVAALRLMLESGWPVDARGDHGATALHWAAWHGSREMVREILRFQPSLEIRSEEFDMTPLGWLIHGSLNGWHCETGDFAGTLETLLEAGAKIPDMPPSIKMSDPVRQVLARTRGP
jgi:ankyrin repeat protein